jgi:hypothetical protein
MGTNLVMPNTYLNLSTGPVLSRPSPRSCLKQGTTNLPRKKVQMITQQYEQVRAVFRKASMENNTCGQSSRTQVSELPKLTSDGAMHVWIPYVEYLFRLGGGKESTKWQGRKGVRRRRVGIMMMQVVSASRSSYMLHGNQWRRRRWNVPSLGQLRAKSIAGTSNKPA